MIGRLRSKITFVRDEMANNVIEVLNTDNLQDILDDALDIVKEIEGIFE